MKKTHKPYMQITLHFRSFSDKVAFNQVNRIMPAEIIAEGPGWQTIEDCGTKFENSPFVYRKNPYRSRKLPRFSIGDTVHVDDGTRAGFDGKVTFRQYRDPSAGGHSGWHYKVAGKWRSEASLTRANPYRLRKLHGSRFYRVTGRRGRVHAKHTTRKKAKAQLRLLRGLERGLKLRKNPAKRPRREKVLVVYPKLDAMLGTTPGQELISKAEALRRGLRVEDEDESRMKQNPARRTTPARRRRAAQIASRDARAAGTHVLLIHRPGKYFYTMVGSRASLLTKVRLAFGKKYHYFTGELAAWILSAKKGERKNLHGNRLAFK